VHPPVDKQLVEDGEVTPAHAASIAVQAVSHTHPLVATQVAEVVNVAQAAAVLAHEAETAATAGTATVTAGTAADALTGAT
jgi:hypothetical protein